MAFTKHNNYPEIPIGAVEWPALYNDAIQKIDAGRTIKAIVGEAGGLTKGKPFYIHSDGKAYLALSTTAQFGLWQTASTAQNTEGYGQVSGIIKTGTRTAGVPVYVSATGTLTTTAPSATAVPIAYSISTTELTIVKLIKEAGNVVGPASAVNDNLVVFDGTTGKLIKDSGNLAADVADAVLKRVLIGDIFSPFVSSGLTATVAGTDNKVTIAAGTAYNIQRLHTTTNTVLTVTNTGAAHTEYVSVHTSGALIITTTARTANELAVADVSVNATGVATAVTDVRQLKLHLKTVGVERLTVDKDGRVSIGTTMPFSELHIVNEEPFKPVFTLTNYLEAAPTAGQFSMERARGTLASPAALVDGDRMGVFKAKGYAAGFGDFLDSAYIMFEADGNEGTQRIPGRIKFMTSDGTAGPADRVIIDKDGNFGIGTALPNAKLHTDDPTTTATKVLFQVESSVVTANTIKARIEADGEMFSDIGFTTFSPKVSDDPKIALQQALAEANKPKKPYAGFVPDEKYIAEVEKVEKQQRKALKETAKQLLEWDRKGEKEKGDKLKELQGQKEQLLESQKQQQAEWDKIKKQVVNLKEHKATALKHGVKNVADEKNIFGKDVSKIAIGLAKYCQQLEERCKQFESKIAKLEAICEFHTKDSR